MTRTLRVRTVRLVAAAAAIAMLTACGSSNGTSGGSASSASNATGDASFWTLKDPTNTVQQAGIDAFNATGKGTVTMNAVPSDGYLDKLRVAMGSSQAPSLFFSWGGGPMRDYATANKIVDVSTLPGGSEIAAQFLPSVLQVGETADGKVVGVPCRGTQPVFLFYNKQVFADAGVEPPTTWNDVENLITTFKSKDIIPFAVAGQGSSAWTQLMWLEYLTDRIGGSEVFAKIQSGDASGWKDPAITQSLEMIQKMVNDGAFGTSFASATYGTGGTSTLVSSGKAAMQLMGSWEYATQLGESPEFAKSGMGYVAFPAIDGGKGDPAAVVGNPSNYVSVSTNAPGETAAGYLKTLYSADYIKGLVDAGEVPVTTNAKEALASAPDPAYASFQYDLVQKAPTFTQSWDQALGTKISTPMLAELQKIFNGQSAPDDFVNALSSLS